MRRVWRWKAQKSFIGIKRRKCLSRDVSHIIVSRLFCHFNMLLIYAKLCHWGWCVWGALWSLSKVFSRLIGAFKVYGLQNVMKIFENLDLIQYNFKSKRLESFRKFGDTRTIYLGGEVRFSRYFIVIFIEFFRLKIFTGEARDVSPDLRKLPLRLSEKKTINFFYSLAQHKPAYRKLNQKIFFNNFSNSTAHHWSYKFSFPFNPFHDSLQSFLISSSDDFILYLSTSPFRIK